MRSGFYLAHRAVFEEVETASGTLARYIFQDIVENARVASGDVTLESGITINLLRGEALTSCRSLAERHRTSASTVFRAIRRLESNGFLCRRPKQWLKHGKGMAPTIVSVTNYDQFCGRYPSRHCHRETKPGKEETKYQEETSLLGRRVSIQHLREKQEVVNDGSDRGEIQSEIDSIVDAEGVLSFYRGRIRDECNPSLALSKISEQVERFGIRVVAMATGRFVASSTSRQMSAEWFYSDQVFPAYRP